MSNEHDFPSMVQVPPSVAILLCTYQGEMFLEEQLESIGRQSHWNWTVWASDNGSTDGTLAILQRYRSEWGADKLNIRNSNAQGPTKNFMSLVHSPEIRADFYSYCDQDDIWEPNKLSRSIQSLTAHTPADCPRTPVLYGARTRYVDVNNDEVGLSPLFRRHPGFANALMQNIAGGNTMMFNHPARELLLAMDRDLEIVIHDWWTYLVVSGCGGTVVYDPEPSVRYRQHADNQIGRNDTWSARITRVRLLFHGRFKEWSDCNIKALQQMEPRLTSTNRQILARFAMARHRWLLPRLLDLKRAGVYRQTLLGNLGIVAGAVFNKL
jgi:glycosyltransferase involved in cell wall biosynthesis